MFAGYCALAEGKPPRLQELVLPDAALLPAFAAALAQHTELPVYVYSFTRGSGRSLPILPLWRNRAFVCQTTATAFSIGRLRPRRNGAAAHL